MENGDRPGGIVLRIDFDSRTSHTRDPAEVSRRRCIVFRALWRSVSSLIPPRTASGHPHGLSSTQYRVNMSEPNGTPQVNGFHKPIDATDLENNGSLKADGVSDIPPADLHNNPEYIKSITIPLNETTAFTPRKKLRVVTIGAGYSGMTLAQKLQHKYAEELNTIVDHVIYEARDTLGGTWDANTYPGVQCDVPSAIYVCFRGLDHLVQNLLVALRHSLSTQIRNGVIFILRVTKSWIISGRPSRSGI